ncbi:MAG: hypothetical protein EBQ80_03900 [Proteobacteria bacterium]|nr:hypothetical protein [Pseudomonadota bacterium]
MAELKTPVWTTEDLEKLHGELVGVGERAAAAAENFKPSVAVEDLPVAALVALEQGVVDPADAKRVREDDEVIMSL